MNRQPMFCDFCGSAEPLIPYDEPAFCWYACPECTQLIENEDWDRLTERCFAAHRVPGPTLVQDKTLLESQAKALVEAFRKNLLLPA